jgi:Holliday junction resolvase RusA-like endonuclease
MEFQGEPLTKGNMLNANRKRWAKLNFYIPERIKLYESALRVAAANAYTGLVPDCPIRLEVVYYLCSKRRKDVGNLCKTTCDSLNQLWYKDDNNIVELVLSKKLDTENPRVEITAFQITTTGTDSDEVCPIVCTYLSSPRDLGTIPSKPKRKKRASAPKGSKAPSQDSNSDTGGKDAQKPVRKTRKKKDTKAT